jgi:two-component system sensor histidine kinase SenX3
MAHELKKPLAVIRALLYKLGKSDTEQCREIVPQIDFEVSGATATLDNIITINKLELRQLSPSTELDLSVLCQKILDQRRDLYQHHFWKAKITTGVRLITPAENIFYILENLLDNAAKYSPGGTTVTLTLKQTKDSITLSVQDAGQGVSQTEQEHIFEPFYWTQSALSQAAGSGLGLAIVLRATSNLGGKLALQSKPKAGTTFTVTIPR